jgi:hypothetical protein
MRARRLLAVVLLTLAALAAAASDAAEDAAPSAATAKKPKLLVVLVVDQLRSDYPDRFGKSWSKGLARLLREGVSYTNAAFPYLHTVTCAGHATIGTGAFPSTHGLSLNAWWNRETRKTQACTSDPDQPLVAAALPPVTPGKDPEGHSARFMEIETLGDVLRKAKPAGRVVSVAMKARSAIAMAGHGGDVVTWFEKGQFVTSRAFAERPVPVLESFILKRPPAVGVPAQWELLLPAATYQGADEVAWEHTPTGWDRSFPHRLKSDAGQLDVAAWAASPWADAYVAELAIHALQSLALGKGAGVDLLTLSFSSLDFVGHSFGPDSHEIQDVLARLDVTLGRLLDALDRQVGRNGYVVALSSDHGVAPIPEVTGQGGRLLPLAVSTALEAALTPVLGPGPHVDVVLYTDVYFTAATLEKLRARPALWKRLLTAARKVPGVRDAFVGSELRATDKKQPPNRMAAALSYFPGRNGDLLLDPAPHWIAVSEGTTHGSAHPYDQRVPVILAGPGITAGRSERPASPADIAPTLAAVAGVYLPRAQGRPLPEASGCGK